MSTDIITLLRPVDGRSVSIEDALARARDALAKATEDVTQARHERDEALLDAPQNVLHTKERKLIDARRAAEDMAERVQAVTNLLEKRLADAKRRELLAAVEDGRMAVEDSQRALEAWWSDAEPVLLDMIEQGRSLRSTAQNHRQDWDRLSRNAQTIYPDFQATYPKVPTGNADTWHDRIGSLIGEIG